MSDYGVTERATIDVSTPAPRWAWRWARWLAAIVAAVVLLAAIGAVGVAYATYNFAQEYKGRILPGTVVAGVNLSGMTPRAALRAVRSELEPRLERTITVAYRSREWRLTPRGIGAHTNAARVVRAAVSASAETTFLEKMRMRMLGEDLGFERSVSVTYPRRGVRSFVDTVADNLDLEPRNASLDYSSGWVEITPERNGRKVDERRGRAALMRTLRNGSPRTTVPVQVLKPEVTTEDYGEVLLVRIGENRLYLYQDGRITRSWPIATGQPEYMTPTGQYEITDKRYLPTWINPAPTTWGKDLPPEIPPGPDNPLGLRALNWSAPAIRFHGTEATYSLGYNASHGCVRLSNSDVIQLYDLVDIGTPIVSLVAGPLKPLYVSSPDPTPVAENDGSAGGGKKQSKDSEPGRR